MICVATFAMLCASLLAIGEHGMGRAADSKVKDVAADAELDADPGSALVLGPPTKKEGKAQPAAATPSKAEGLFKEPLRCLVRFYELNQPNCGEKNPECPLLGPYQRVNISEDANFRYVETSYCPPYDWSCIRSPKRLRPCARSQTFKIPLRPTVASAPVQLGLGWPRGGLPHAKNASRPNSVELSKANPMLGAIGVLLNGVSINGVACKLSETLEEGQQLKGEDAWVDAGAEEQWMDDTCGGHLSGGANYHTHVGAPHKPKKRIACGLPADEAGAHSKLLGWAFDGYSIYGPLEGNGTEAPSDLDSCGGHVGEEQGGYHYHLSETYPYTLECYHGCPEKHNNFRFKDIKCEAKGQDRHGGEL